MSAPLTDSLSDNLSESIADIVQRVGQSLVVLHNGRKGIGAGIIWGEDGLILTNFHVIDHRRDLQVGLENGDHYPARLISKEPEIDLALLQITAQGLKKAAISVRDLRVGQLVFAVGHPWGQRRAVTAGLVSSLGTAETGGRRGQVDVIRSDARLAPGNSGGPLVDAAGAVVGINTMIVGGDQGIALPSHIASDFVEGARGRI